MFCVFCDEFENYVWEVGLMQFMSECLLPVSNSLLMTSSTAVVRFGGLF